MRYSTERGTSPAGVDFFAPPDVPTRSAPMAPPTRPATVAGMRTAAALLVSRVGCAASLGADGEGGVIATCTVVAVALCLWGFRWRP